MHPDFATSPVVELRQYTLRPGRYDDLHRLFESELVEPQEAVGMRLGGRYADREDPDRFVWFRGFASMPDRLRALTDFYDGPVWAAHRDAANATMLDSDDVLLLRPTDPPHPPVLAGDRVVVEVRHVDGDVDVHDELERALGVPVGTWRTHPGPHDFPRLPVREEQVLVWVAAWPDEPSARDALARLDDLDLPGTLDRRLHLRPTGG